MEPKRAIPREQRRKLSDVLRASPSGLPPEVLLKKSGYTHETIDEFYAELGRLVREGRVEKSQNIDGQATLRFVVL